MSADFKYFAFISYSSHDIEWGKRLQKKLERYRLPATLCSEHNLPRTPMKPVFFAPTDIQPGDLDEELKERLRSSRHLIVICSPHSANSDWVGKEIEYFHSLGRTNNIHFFIVEGIPHSGNPDTECFNPIIAKLGLPEILGANINEKVYHRPWMNRERACVQLISKLLGVEFDTIWQRHKRLLINRIVAFSLGGFIVLAALFGIWLVNQPFDAKISLNEKSFHNKELPPLKNALIAMYLDNELKSDTIFSMDSSVLFTNIPHRYLNQKVRFIFSCNDYIGVDTILYLERDVVLNIERDPLVYGDVHFCIWDPQKDQYVSNAQIEIDGREIFSNKEGCVSLFIPLESQKTAYQIKASFIPQSKQIIMPCGESDIISIK